MALEETSAYYRALDAALQATGLPVSVLNPAEASNFVRSQYRRNKTDKADALWLAVYARERRPGPGLPASYLVQWVTRRPQALEKDLTCVRKRLAAAEAGHVRWTDPCLL